MLAVKQFFPSVRLTHDLASVFTAFSGIVQLKFHAEVTVACAVENGVGFVAVRVNLFLRLNLIEAYPAAGVFLVLIIFIIVSRSIRDRTATNRAGGIKLGLTGLAKGGVTAIFPPNAGATMSA
jgi:hypothetical protein